MRKGHQTFIKEINRTVNSTEFCDIVCRVLFELVSRLDLLAIAARVWLERVRHKVTARAT